MSAPRIMCSSCREAGRHEVGRFFVQAASEPGCDHLELVCVDCGEVERGAGPRLELGQ